MVNLVAVASLLSDSRKPYTKIPTAVDHLSLLRFKPASPFGSAEFAAVKHVALPSHRKAL